MLKPFTVSAQERFLVNQYWMTHPGMSSNGHAYASPHNPFPSEETKGLLISSMFLKDRYLNTVKFEWIRSLMFFLSSCLRCYFYLFIQQTRHSYHQRILRAFASGEKIFPYDLGGKLNLTPDSVANCTPHSKNKI